jgi:phosphotriesterase-related protein
MKVGDKEDVMNRSISSLSGKVQTVLGLKDPSELGITLAHEHCLIDLTCVFSLPKTASAKKLAYEPVSLQNLGYIRYNVNANRDNLLLLDEKQAIDELLPFKRSGGNTIVDVTNVDLGRDPLALKQISIATELNIIMGSGYYLKGGQNLLEMDGRTEEDIAEEIAGDISEGVRPTGIRAGVIGEIGCSWPLEDCEKKVLRAAGIAQKATGAPLSVHPGRFEEAPKEIIKILKEVDSDLNHTVICHIDRTVFDPKNRYMIAEAGCYLGYDIWGIEGYYPESLSITDVLNDTQRIAQIKDLMAQGYGKQILISHDICYKCRYLAYGGHGYEHILANAVPAMLSRGMSEDHINDLLVENPKIFLTFT